MSAFWTMCRIEALKLRRTLAAWMVVIAPAVVVALQMLAWARNRTGFPAGLDLWLSFATNVLSMWAIFMQPLFVALVAALVYHADHSTQGWLRMGVTPLPRWTIPAAKLAVVLSMSLAATLLVAAGALGGAAVSPVLNGRVVLPATIPLAEIAARTGKVLLASLPIVAIQNLVSLRFSSLVVSLGVGITGTFMALFATGWRYGPYFPWLMGIQAIHGKDAVVARILWVAPTLAIAVVVATVVLAARRDPGASV